MGAGGHPFFADPHHTRPGEINHHNGGRGLYFEDPDGHNMEPTREDWSLLSRAWTARIDERIAELHRLRAGLTECIGCGCLSLERCRLANPMDRAAALGPGPRHWIGDPPRAAGG